MLIVFRRLFWFPRLKTPRTTKSEEDEIRPGFASPGLKKFKEIA